MFSFGNNLFEFFLWVGFLFLAQDRYINNEFFTFFVFWFDEGLGGGEEVLFCFLKKSGIKKWTFNFYFYFFVFDFFTFSFWNKKRKLLL